MACNVRRVDLAAMSGIVAVDAANQRATILGGTRLCALGAPLAASGLALHNQGDVDTQAIAGALATATHGTGPACRNLSSAVVTSRLVLASGDVVDCSETTNGDLFQASRVSLGALGVLSSVEMALSPAYRLAERTWLEPTTAVLARLDELIAATRHFEFFWLPDQDRCFCKSLQPTDLPASPPESKPERVLGADGLWGQERIGPSWQIFPSVREDRFNEMEFFLPAERGPAAFLAVRELMMREYPDVTWPIEYRTLAADDAWLSPASGRDSVTISVHQGAALPYETFFRATQDIFVSFGGRPHWGKIHWLGPSYLGNQFSHWDRFWSTQHTVDPKGRLLNNHLRALRDG